MSSAPLCTIPECALCLLDESALRRAWNSLHPHQRLLGFLLYVRYVWRPWNRA